MLKIFLRNSDALGTVSISGPFSKINLHSVGHGWKLDRWEMPSRQSSACTIYHVTVAGVTSVKHADLYKHTLRSTNITWHRVCFKNSPKCKHRRPQNILEWSKGLADWNEQHIQQTQEIHPHVSDRQYDQSTQLRHLYHPDSCYHKKSKKTTTPSSVDWVGKLAFFCCWYYMQNLSVQWWLLFW
jgi:hypothetical protein